jgi:endonuclease YncB( thermonuclease family)
MDGYKFEEHGFQTNSFSLCNMQTYARLVDIYDGDTMTCIIPIKYCEHCGHTYFKFNIRLLGIDTQEMKSKEEAEKNKALLARKLVLDTLCNSDVDLHCSRAEVRDLLDKNVVCIWLECFEMEKYGRVLANVYKEKNGESVNHMLLQRGLAYEYFGGTKEK